MAGPGSVPTEISLGKHVQCLGCSCPAPQTPGLLYSDQQLYSLEEANVKVAGCLLRPALWL